VAKRFLFIVLLTFIPSVASAQLGIGFGIAIPVIGGDIPTSAVVDGAGVVRVDEYLEATPRILIEVHREFRVNERGVGIGPALGIIPIFDTGLSSNTDSDRGPGIGAGGARGFGARLAGGNLPLRRFASGGGVPALTTPGELIFGPKAASQAGVGGLKHFNEIKMYYCKKYHFRSTQVVVTNLEIHNVFTEF